MTSGKLKTGHRSELETELSYSELSKGLFASSLPERRACKRRLVRHSCGIPNIRGSCRNNYVFCNHLFKHRPSFCSAGNFRSSSLKAVQREIFKLFIKRFCLSLDRTEREAGKVHHNVQLLSQPWIPGVREGWWLIYSCALHNRQTESTSLWQQ